MRGEEKRKNRAARLRQLKKQVTYKTMADLAGVSEGYLSQIGNETIQPPRKTPRGLSDAYAEKIEIAIGLESGWFDQPVNESTLEVRQEPATYAKNPDLVAIIQLVSNGQISAEALQTLAQVARYMARNDSHNYLSNSIADDSARRKPRRRLKNTATKSKYDTL